MNTKDYRKNKKNKTRYRQEKDENFQDRKKAVSRKRKLQELRERDLDSVYE